MTTLPKQMDKQTRATLNIPHGLLTAQAVNLKFASLREKFRTDANCEKPTPFIVWREKLTDEQAERIQQAFAARATKADAELIAPAEDTLRWMIRNRRA